MKKNLLIGTVAAMVTLGGAAVVGASDDNNIVENQTITAEQAIQTAFKKVEGFVQEVELSFEEDENYYEVQIESSVNEYEFNIDAATGKIAGQKTENIVEEKQEETGQKHSVDESNYSNESAAVTSLEEYDTIINQVDAEDLTFHLVTDNSGNRIMFLVDGDGNKHFKTIFLKHDNLLKIIDMNGDGQVYNGNL
ncbi:PepSY domain-containing protein [Oceanobacillus sp. FSL K6-2867]|uniref:PepSY domain-containing protein n=1 Tax=Oceanobacillus sp. FSL K6-2867 TaxID=2954748 RepID=UPI0030D82C9D